MRCYLVGVVFCGICTAVYCLPNAARDSHQDDKYLDLIRELADEVLEEKTVKDVPSYNNRDDGYGDDEANAQAIGNHQRSNVPPYISRDEQYIDRASAQAKENDQRSNDPPYTDKEERYMQLARQVADQYMEDTRAKYQESEQVGAHSASDSLRAFNRPSRRTQRIAEQNERDTAELETLLLLTANENEDELQRRHMIDLTAKKAKNDPSCTFKVDCNDNKNLNFVDDIEFRTINGTCNNKKNYTWGMAGAQHRRLLPDAYRNGKWQIRDRGVDNKPLPHPRFISNVVHRSPTPKPDNDASISLAAFYFLQFIDHDLAKTPEGEISKKKDCCKKAGKYCMPIKIDVDDHRFKKGYCMDARRSFTLFRCNDDTGFQNQINEITSYLDASMIYGSSAEDEETLRECQYGLLKESTGGFLPFSDRASHLPCNMTSLNTPGEQCRVCYEAGDTRANIVPGLLSYHTLFVREHNRIALKLAALHSEWSNDRIYQETKRIITAMIQHIVYEDVLPILLREEEMKKYGIKDDYKYDDEIDASMTQAFSMGFRYHNMMPQDLHLARPDGTGATNFQAIKQELAIQRPNYVSDNAFHGIEEVALGMVVASCPYVDRLMNAATSDFLFLDKDGSSFDLVVLNIMRAREWGMQSYTEYREFCGLGIAIKWDDLTNTHHPDDIDKLKAAYSDVRDVDFWPGIMTEKVLPGTISGATQTCLLSLHFANVKHGDRFWYERGTNGFKPNQLIQIKQKTSLARILCDNLSVAKMRSNVFRTNSPWLTCDKIREQSGGDWKFEDW